MWRGWCGRHGTVFSKSDELCRSVGLLVLHIGRRSDEFCRIDGGSSRRGRCADEFQHVERGFQADGGGRLLLFRQDAF